MQLLRGDFSVFRPVSDMLHRSAFHLDTFCVDRRRGVGQGPKTEIFSPMGATPLVSFYEISTA